MLRFYHPAVLLCALALSAAGAVRLPYLYADHMVLQRDMPVHFWGWAAPEEAVSVTFRGETRTSRADELGRWSIHLSPGPAGGPFEAVVCGSSANPVTFRDVLVGDVWVAAGQSNMEWPVAWAAKPREEMAAANYPRIRLARTMHRVSDYPRDDFIGAQWAPCTPQSVEKFSAAAYHFGRDIHDKIGVPVGLIQSAWGGTPVEAWTSLRALSADAGFMPVFAEWAKLTAEHPANAVRFQSKLREWEAAARSARAEGRPVPDKPELRRRPGGQWMPGGLYNGMIEPLVRYPIKGVLWYQGEANTAPERAPLYGRVFQAMIRDWRRAWGQGEFPFLFVQLANFRGAEDAMWPELREAQRKALALANTAMAVTIDIGNPDDIHPGNKREVGRRLALAALATVYGQKIEFSGPLFRQATRENGGALRLWFDHAGGLTVRNGSEPRGFEVRAAEGRFFPALARIDGATVVVYSPEVPRPVEARYAWADNPAANLYNAAGLPASPFRSLE